MKNICLILAYVGTAYSGWQDARQNSSVEKTLKQALETVLQHPIQLQAASRTDAGVHARGQVVHFFSSTDLPLERIQLSLNRLLPRDIVVREIKLANPSFHPTLDALQKEYHYEICYGPVQLPFVRATSWHFPHPLNLLEMKKASTFLLGSHDFSSFCNERSLWDRNPVCFLEKVDMLPLTPDRLKIVLRADHFLYKMARNLVGTLAYVGCGKISADHIPKILSSKDRTLAGMTAPAKGLRLEQVFYSGSFPALRVCKGNE